MNIPGAAQFLTGSNSSRGTGSRLMHQPDRQVELPPKRAIARQQLVLFAGDVLVGAVKSHARIRKEQAGPERLGFLPEPRTIRTAIDADQGRGDHVDLDLDEIDTAMPKAVQANKLAIRVAISTYDAFERADAAVATSNGVVVNWLAIGSTASVRAITHIATTPGITGVYLPDGTLVTHPDGAAGTWSCKLLQAPDETTSAVTES